MADNEHVYDGDVRRITAAELVPEGGRFRLMFRIKFKDGRIQHRRANQCTCPEAVGEFERLYYRGKVDAQWSPGPSPAKPTSNSKSETSSSRADATDVTTPSKDWRDEGDGSEYADDAHLDHISSDDSLWADVVDREGRPGTNPEARAAIRKEWAAADETFKTPKTEGGGSSDSDDVSNHTHKASVKSEALSDDSLAQELKAKAHRSPGESPNPRTAGRGAGRRRAARNLSFDKPARLKTFEEWAFGRKKTTPDPDAPSGSGLQSVRKREAKADNSPKASTSQRYKMIKLKDEDGSLPAMPAFPAGQPKGEKKEVEVVDLTLDDDIFTIDSD